MKDSTMAGKFKTKGGVAAIAGETVESCKTAWRRRRLMRHSNNFGNNCNRQKDISHRPTGERNSDSLRSESMGPTRFELVTSSLSGTRSNQLSYEPVNTPKRWRKNCRGRQRGV